MEPPVRRKKRPRRSDSSDSNVERRRGRPRVQKEDESTADRRRTQIRMAQRAYRQRKESTLDDLRKRVAELTNTIELMNKTFGGYRERILVTSMSQDQMVELSKVSAQIERFVRETRSTQESSEEGTRR